MKLGKLAIFALIGITALFGWFIAFNAIGANSAPAVSNVKTKTIIGKDGAEMVLIPAGEFTNGEFAHVGEFLQLVVNP